VLASTSRAACANAPAIAAESATLTASVLQRGGCAGWPAWPGPVLHVLKAPGIKLMVRLLPRPGKPAQPPLP
jgi:hypothetical protein